MSIIPYGETHVITQVKLDNCLTVEITASVDVDGIPSFMCVTGLVKKDKKIKNGTFKWISDKFTDNDKLRIAEEVYIAWQNANEFPERN